MTLTEFRPEQFRVRDILTKWFDELRKVGDLPIFSIQLEHDVKEWKKFGDVDGVELRGMPSLDLVILFLGMPKPKIGIQLDGGIHKGFKSLIDQNQKIVLDKKWGYLLRFIQSEDDRIWDGSEIDCLNQLTEKIEPILKEFKFMT